MKIERTYKLIYLLVVLILYNCASTRLTESWKNPNYSTYTPKKVLVIGVTPNLEARSAFEFKLKSELNAREIIALQSAVVFEASFKDSKQTEADIEKQLDVLRSKGLDAILVSVVKGVENKQSYASESSKTDYHLRRFSPYYLLYQEAYYNQNYYSSYNVFHIETSLYSLKSNSDKSLVWSGSYDIVDPKDVTKTIDKYVEVVIKSLEKEKIIPKKHNYLN
ncbi:hypothetical protein [Jejuia pallidilutea]|uniref:Cardiolipin synthetase n=1 Tax=Jejuia pallidilutea TaxID=504487 RepID=A0A090VM59_9FLAO|nr:hypothetical protein [Jejuia pallidilutea]GAL65811.1 hypothetical protein JCM19301_3496 [Jejuia pallidilutea]GAL88538.1 hypothetical protein JCM19538_3051 [Jejuia pallidilutea]